MSLVCVMGLGAPAPVLEDTGSVLLVCSLGSFCAAPPTLGRVPAHTTHSEFARQLSDWEECLMTPLLPLQPL